MVENLSGVGVNLFKSAFCNHSEHLTLRHNIETVNARLDEQKASFARLEDKIDSIDRKLNNRIDKVEDRLVKLDDKIDSIDRKFDKKFDDLSKEVGRLSREVGELKVRMSGVETRLNGWQPTMDALKVFLAKQNAA